MLVHAFYYLVHRDPLHRIVREGVLIKKVLDGEKARLEIENKEVDVPIVLLNSKREWFKPNIMAGVQNVGDRL